MRRRSGGGGVVGLREQKRRRRAETSARQRTAFRGLQLPPQENFTAAQLSRRQAPPGERC